jgi:hypothetical protein
MPYDVAVRIRIKLRYQLQIPHDLEMAEAVDERLTLRVRAREWWLPGRQSHEAWTKDNLIRSSDNARGE